jgi:hypothetical protein
MSCLSCVRLTVFDFSSLVLVTSINKLVRCAFSSDISVLNSVLGFSFIFSSFNFNSVSVSSLFLH